MGPIEYATVIGGDDFFTEANAFRLPVHQGKGNCGYVYACPTSIVKNRLIGIHIAGGPAHSYGSYITQELIASVLVECEMLVTKDFEKSQVDIDQLAHENITFVGISNKQVRMPCSSEIRPTFLYDESKALTQPALLTPKYQPDGTRLYPLLEALKKKHHKPKTDYAPSYLRDVKDFVLEHESMVFAPRNLTLEESINGVMNIRPIELSTSMGFPFNTVMSNVKGKNGYFTRLDDHIAPTEEMAFIIEQCDAAINSGITPENYPLVTVDCLKYDRLP